MAENRNTRLLAQMALILGLLALGTHLLERKGISPEQVKKIVEEEMARREKIYVDTQTPKVARAMAKLTGQETGDFQPRTVEELFSPLIEALGEKTESK